MLREEKKGREGGIWLRVVTWPSGLPGWHRRWKNECETERWERWELSIITGTSRDTAEVNSVQTLTCLIC